jgi:hypothetical protein
LLQAGGITNTRQYYHNIPHLITETLVSAYMYTYLDPTLGVV